MSNRLIAEVIKEDDIVDYQGLLDNPVHLKFRKSNIEEYVNQTLFPLGTIFQEEIKTVNRFHLNNPLDLEKLKSIIHFFKRNLQRKIFLPCEN
ncbi:MAG: hypothetical protein IPN46_19150 [Saprospiraceae bacterium]|nr:hypothetical protein [Saprospiraceae bacterium]